MSPGPSPVGGRSALVTGAASGIGLAIALEAAARCHDRLRLAMDAGWLAH